MSANRVVFSAVSRSVSIDSSVPSIKMDIGDAHNGPGRPRARVYSVKSEWAIGDVSICLLKSALRSLFLLLQRCSFLSCPVVSPSCLLENV